ncbi:hypothetical protein [Allostreptomyces psammosilenae]|uniref:Uncharacterized protein n=1 Tax=Allostreptomyces psammosilenae TaxID=1892865 RepID=A0A853A5K6_9ACTN|nr:hypothetical protein [Allostreptomyces psammosilenae]NYI05772.1 hypothetical protein [Allostreptomyces psammosilenae]
MKGRSIVADGVLSAEEVTRIREGVAEAILGAPEGLREGLEHDPESFLRLVAATRVGAEETSRLLREAVGGARGAGHSWDTLGRLLGVSRQAAQQRFATPSPDKAGAQAATETADAPTGERRVLSPLTAFDEMPALAEAGRAGWQLVDYGPLYHVVEASDRQWEHRRVALAMGARRRRLEAEGWIAVGSGYFPWSYYKRPVAQADPPPASSQ